MIKLGTHLLLPPAMSDEDALELALGALADIGTADDMTLDIARAKARGIYAIIRKRELDEEARGDD